MIAAALSGFCVTMIAIAAAWLLRARRKRGPLKGPGLDRLGVTLRLPRAEGEKDKRYLERLINHARGNGERR